MKSWDADRTWDTSHGSPQALGADRRVTVDTPMIRHCRKIISMLRRDRAEAAEEEYYLNLPDDEWPSAYENSDFLWNFLRESDRHWNPQKWTRRKKKRKTSKRMTDTHSVQARTKPDRHTLTSTSPSRLCCRGWGHPEIRCRRRYRYTIIPD